MQLINRPCNVYCLTCISTGLRYIGITIQAIKNRWADHQKAAKRGEKTYLYNAIRKYGKENFEVSHLATAPSWEEGCRLEVMFIKEFRTKKPLGYNLTDGGDGALGFVHSIETRQKMSALRKLHKPRIVTQETREKLRKSGLGKNHSEEAKAKISAKRKGRKFGPRSQEAIAKTAAANRGRKRSPQGVENIRAAAVKRRGIYFGNEESRKKISATHKGKKQSPEFIAKRISAYKKAVFIRNFNKAANQCEVATC